MLHVCAVAHTRTPAGCTARHALPCKHIVNSLEAQNPEEGVPRPQRRYIQPKLRLGGKRPGIQFGLVKSCAAQLLALDDASESEEHALSFDPRSRGLRCYRPKLQYQQSHAV